MNEYKNFMRGIDIKIWLFLMKNEQSHFTTRTKSVTFVKILKTKRNAFR